jgi:hypothetical protein
MKVSIKSNAPIKFDYQLGIPLNIPGLQMWYNGDDPNTFNTVVPASGDNVFAWADSSPNGFDLIQPVTIDMPRYFTGSMGKKRKPLIYIEDGFDELYRTGTSMVNLNPLFAIHIVFKVDNSQTVLFSDDRLLDNSGSGSGILMTTFFNDLRVNIGGVNIFALSGVIAHNKPYMASLYTQQNGPNIDVFLRVNGVLEGSATIATPTLALRDFQLGRLGVNAGGIERRISEVITSEFEKSLTDIEAVESYLDAKYGLTGFHPQVAGLVTWIDATDESYVTKDAFQRVSLVKDKNFAGLTDNLVQGTALNQPTWIPSGMGANSLPYLSFNGLDQFMEIITPSASMQSQDFTLFIVAKTDANAQSYWFRSWNGASFDLNNENVFHNGSDVSFQARDGASAQDVTVSDAVPGDKLFTYSFDSVGAGTSKRIVNRNGVEIVNQPTRNPLSSNGNDVYVGTSNNGGGAGWSAPQVSEWLYYDRVLTPAEIADVEDYINNKYGLF